MDDEAHAQPGSDVAGEADVAALIAARIDGFSPNDRLIAEYVLLHRDEAAFASADSLARAVGVSKAAVVRFGARVGLGGWAGLHDALVAHARRRLAGAREPEAPVRPLLRGDGAAPLLGRLHGAARENLEASLESTDAGALERAAAVLESGEGWIHVFGQRASAAVSEYAYFLLNPLFPNVHRVEAGESALADALIDLGPEDRVLAVTFRRYARLTTEVLRFAQERGAPVVLVTDSAGAPAAAHATEVLVCSAESPVPLRSMVAGVFMVEALAALLLERNPHTAGRRLADAERLWGRFGTY